MLNLRQVCKRCWRRYQSSSANTKARRLHLKALQTSGPFNILFLGRDEFSVLVLDQLFENSGRKMFGVKFSLLRTKTNGLEEEGHNYHKAPLKLRSQSLGLETHLIPSKSTFKDWKPPAHFTSASSSPNNLLVTASFGRLLSDRLLHLFPVTRRLNVHPSLIPLYRGPAPIQHAIADGREETGVCVLEMKEKKYGADGGEVWASKTVKVPQSSDFTFLRNKLGMEGGKLLVSVLRDMINGTACAGAQDDTKATRAPFITQETAVVNFMTWDADKVERMYRAIAHQKPIITFLPSSKSLQLHAPQVFAKAPHVKELPKPLRALNEPGDATFDPLTSNIAIRCANDSYLLLPSVKQQDRKLLAAKEWWNGVRPEWLNNGVLRLGHFYRSGDQPENPR